MSGGPGGRGAAEAHDGRSVCELCGMRFAWTVERPWGPWDGRHPCACGGRHAACAPCAVGLGLVPPDGWGPSAATLAACPLSDEFRVAAAAMGWAERR